VTVRDPYSVLRSFDSVALREALQECVGAEDLEGTVLRTTIQVPLVPVPQVCVSGGGSTIGSKQFRGSAW